MKVDLKEYLGDKEFYSNVFHLAIPISLQSLITIGVNTMDTIMLGQTGEIQLAASSLANQFIIIFHIMCMGLGMGASVMTSRYWGSRDIISLKKSVTLMYRLCFLFAMSFTAATLFFPEGVMRLYTHDSQMIEAGMSYFRWFTPGYLLLGFSLTTTIVLRSIGKVKIPLRVSIFAFFVNIFFNYVFIFGKFGAPRMEIAGAALGTVISRVFEMVLIFGYFVYVDEDVKYRINDLFMDCKDMVAEYFRVSIPVLVSDTLLGLGNSAVSMIMGRIGASFVAANAVTVVVMQLSSVMIQGTANASAIITGTTLGRGNRRKVQVQGYTFWGLGLVIGCISALIILLISKPMIGFYSLSEETRIIARQLMVAISIIIIFQAQNSLLTKGVLRGGGDTRFLMIADILFLWVVSIPLGIFAGLVWHLSAFWILIALKIDQIIKAVWCIFRLRSGKWIKKIEPAGEVKLKEELGRA